jgi:hypothetical protein
MELIVKLAWIVLAFIHLMPSLVLARPAMIQSLYGIAPDGPIAMLLIHRGALFLAVLTACVVALFHAPSRPLAAIIATISMLSFLLLYAKAGMPIGGLRKIALADAIGLPFLAIVILTSLRGQ